MATVSQEVKLLVERDGVLLTLFLRSVSSGIVTSSSFALLVNVGETNPCVELGDLVSVLAGSRYFNRACPVEVEVTQSEGQVLKVNLR